MDQAIGFLLFIGGIVLAVIGFGAFSFSAPGIIVIVAGLGFGGLGFMSIAG